MRAGVAESCPVIIAYHMRSHPEAVSHCSRPLSTHPPPVRTACRAQDFWPLLHFRDDADNCDQDNCVHSWACVECTAPIAAFAAVDPERQKRPKVRAHKDVGNEQV